MNLNADVNQRVNLLAATFSVEELEQMKARMLETEKRLQAKAAMPWEPMPAQEPRPSAIEENVLPDGGECSAVIPRSWRD